MKVLMVGATGKFGSMVLPQLLKRGASVRALVRDETKAAEARKKGASESVIADLGDAASLQRAAEGVQGVFHIGPAFAPDEAEMGVRLVAAAKVSGVSKFCLSGVIHPSLSKLTNHAAKRPVEEALYESGLDFTVLQPTMFMQNIQNSWKQLVETGQFGLPFSKHAKVSYVDYRDVAEAAALALTTDRLAYGTFELCAPGMVDRVETAALMSQALGRSVEAAESEFEAWADAAKLPQGHIRDGMRRMYRDYDQYGFAGGNALVLRAVLEREPRGLGAFFKELAAA